MKLSESLKLVSNLAAKLHKILLFEAKNRFKMVEKIS